MASFSSPGKLILFINEENNAAIIRCRVPNQRQTMGSIYRVRKSVG